MVSEYIEQEVARTTHEGVMILKNKNQIITTPTEPNTNRKYMTYKSTSNTKMKKQLVNVRVLDTLCYKHSSLYKWSET